MHCFRFCFQIQLAPLQPGGKERQEEFEMVSGQHSGRPMQVDPIKPKLKPPGTTRLKLKCDELLSSFALKFTVRRYIVGVWSSVTGSSVEAPVQDARDSTGWGGSQHEGGGHQGGGYHPEESQHGGEAQAHHPGGSHQLGGPQHGGGSHQHHPGGSQQWGGSQHGGGGHQGGDSLNGGGSRGSSHGGELLHLHEGSQHGGGSHHEGGSRHRGGSWTSLHEGEGPSLHRGVSHQARGWVPYLQEGGSIESWRGAFENTLPPVRHPGHPVRWSSSGALEGGGVLRASSNHIQSQAVEGRSRRGSGDVEGGRQWLTLVHFSPQPEPFSLLAPP